MPIWVIIVIAIAGYIIYQKYTKAKNSKKENEKDLLNLTVKDAEVGDIITIAGLGEEFEDVDFTIEKKHRYDSDKGEWFELAGRYGQKNVWIEWDDDDELFITATTSKSGKGLLQIGLTEDKLITFDEESSRENSFRYNGQSYSYEFSGEAAFFKDNKDEHEEFYIWDFISEDKKEVITVEKWEGEPFEVFCGEVIQPYNVTVYKN